VQNADGKFWEDRARSLGELSVAWGGSRQAMRWDNFLRWSAIKKLLPRIRPGFMAIEVGTGSGYYAFKLARMGANVVAVDFCRPLLEFGKSQLRKYNLEVIWVEAAAEDLPLRDDIFDLAVSVTCIQHLTDPQRQEKAVREILRVLRPGGTFILVEDTAPGSRTHVHRGYLLKRSQSGWIELVNSQGGLLRKLVGVSYLRFRKWLPFWASAWLDKFIGVTGLFNRFARVTAFCFVNGPK